MKKDAAGESIVAGVPTSRTDIRLYGFQARFLSSASSWQVLLWCSGPHEPHRSQGHPGSG